MRRATLCFTAVLLVIISTLPGCSKDKALHIKPDIAKGFSDAEVVAIESVVNKYDVAYKSAKSADDPALMSDAYSAWNDFNGKISGMSVSDPIEVTNLKWDLDSMGTCLILANAYAETVKTDENKSSRETLLVNVIDLLGIRKSFGGAELNEENVFEKYWEVTDQVRARVIGAFE